MKQIDLDDLPPRIAHVLAGLEQGEELILVQGGAVVARLAVAAASQPGPGETLPELAPEEQVSEVLSQFNAMIHDEF
jgi:antitoxin (DNA-binding transcriptional repressor) of toxin-antitoxin stability system